MPTIRDITGVLERYAPLSLQESYDNCGIQVGDPDAVCSGVLLAVDATPEIVDEAVTRGCNLIVCHHPLLFRGLKRISPGSSRVAETVIKAIRAGITIYSLHTAIDSAPGGVSQVMAKMLGIETEAPLEPKDSCEGGSPCGLGVIGCIDPPVTPAELAKRIKRAFGSPVVRCNELPSGTISRIALCGGSGSSMVDEALASGAEAFITSDTGYHTFVDYSGRILIMDIGHFEAEKCVKEIFYHIITEFFPNFAVCLSETESNPVIYL